MVDLEGNAMVPGTKILVATDLTETSEDAIRLGRAWAKGAGGEWIACHIVENALHNNVLFPQLVQQEALALVQVEREAEAALLEQVMRVTGETDDSGVSLMVELGSPAAAVVESAERIGAGLLVVGAGARPGIGDARLGSVAERIVRYAHCPVLVARPQRDSDVVLIATDFSDTSLAAVRSGVDVARMLGARVVLMHSIDVAPSRLVGLGVPFGTSPVVPPPDVLEDLGKNVEVLLRDTAEREGIEAAFRVEHGDAPDAICTVARQLEAKLVVLGTAGRTGWRRLALGSVAEQVARSAPCPVLIVRKGKV